MSQSSSKKKKETIQFGLGSLELIDLNLKHPERPLAQDQIFNFDIEINQRFNLDHKAVFNLCSITIRLEDETVVGHIRTSMVYNVPELEKYVSDENQLNLPKDIMIAFNSISLSTLRGIMYSEFKGTFLHNAVLPLVDPKNFNK